MGIVRDVSATLSFGFVPTSKHIDTKAVYEARTQEHHARIEAHNNVLEQVRASEEAMSHWFGRATEALLQSGALAVDADNNLQYGWYQPKEEMDRVEDNPDYRRTGVGATAAFGLGIAAPTAVWTLVSIYGTASTGAAIGSLTGAAAGSAAAAWIGRAATLGSGGMLAGRIALGPIGAASALATAPLGYLIARNRERNFVRAVEEKVETMARYEDILLTCQDRLNGIRPRMHDITAKLQECTGQLEEIQSDTPEGQEIVQNLDQAMRMAVSSRGQLAEAIEERDSELAASDSSPDSD